MGAKSDVVVKLVLVFFISLFSFAIGTFVGKKYSDNQHKLAKLEPDAKAVHGERSVASDHEKTEHGKQTSVKSHDEKSDMVSDEEIKKLTEEALKKEEFIADDTKAEKPLHSPNVPKTAVKNGHQHDEALTAAQEFLDGKAPEAKEDAKKEARIPSSLPKDVAQYAVGKFTVQVASYAEKADAEKKANQLKEMGYQANVFTAQVSGKNWYRVSFGLFASQNEALSEKQKYLEQNKTESALVQKIKN